MTGTEWRVDDESGFLACYRATVAEVYRYAVTLTGGDRGSAEDLVQDVFLGALNRARTGALTTVSVGYLVTSTRHRYLDRLKATRREHRRIELVRASDEGEPAPSGETSGRLADLPVRERAAMILRHVDDLSVAAVAAEMGISVRAAESLIARATRRLRANHRPTEGDLRHA